MRYTVRFLNVPTLGQSFASFNEAVEWGKARGFEFAVDEECAAGVAVLGSWSPVYGLRLLVPASELGLSSW